jgi:putative DNA primase/helicase
MRRNGAHSMAQRTNNEVKNAIEHAVFNRDELGLTSRKVQVIADVASAAVNDLIPKIAYRIVSRPTVIADDEETSIKLLEYDPDDAGNADAVLHLYGGLFLHSDHCGWLTYTGTHWETGGAEKALHDAVVDTLKRRRIAAVKRGKSEDVIKAAVPSTKHVRDCISNLRGRKSLNASITEFNSNDDQINCINGVVNLHTGEIEPHNNTQRFTYCLQTPYDPNADQSEVWAFLDSALEGGHKTAEKLQLALGWGITGNTTYEKFIYLFGKPRAGKGTVKEAIEKTLGILYRAGVFASFVKKREENSNNFDLAFLKDARMVVCDEGDKGSRLNEGKVKQLSGGGTIQASFKHRDPFTFEPKFKLIFISNHNIDADPSDDAFWNRLILFNFPNAHLGENEDPAIKKRLIGKELRPAWLAWLVQGAMRFYAGENKPFLGTDEMREMVISRREELDTQGRWFAEECEADPEAFTTFKDLYKSYNNWAEGQPRANKTDKEFADWLTAHGFKIGTQRVAGKPAKVRVGIRLINPPEVAGFMPK